MVASDDEQVERLREWWNEHGKTVIAGVVLGVAGLLGWFGWQSYQENRLNAAAVAYAQLDQASTIPAQTDPKLIEEAREFAETYSGTAYAPLALLIGASLATEHDQISVAIAYLERVRETASERELVATAQLQLARLLWSEGKHEQARATLTDPPAGFTSLFYELEGDIAADQGDIAGARAAYEQAIEIGGGQLVGLKLDSLPAETQGDPL